MNYLNAIKVGSLFLSALLFSLFLHLNLFIFHPDPGKTLPESLDYNVFWLQTVAGEVDSKTGIPPPLLCLRIKDFLNGPGGCDEHAHAGTSEKIRGVFTFSVNLSLKEVSNSFIWAKKKRKLHKNEKAWMLSVFLLYLL